MGRFLVVVCLRARAAHRLLPVHGLVGAELRRHHHRAVGVVRHGERGGVGEIGANVGDHLGRTLGARVVHAVREQDDEHVALGIDPERRAGEAGVPVRVLAEILAAAARAAAGVPAERARAGGARC